MPENWVSDIGKSHEAPIKFIECMPHGESGGRSLVEIDATGSDMERLVEDIRNHPDVCKVDVSPLTKGSTLGSIVTSKCMACRALTGSDCFLTTAKSLDDGRVEWNLITGQDGSLADLLEKLETVGCEVELKKTARISSKSLMTTRQGQILKAAYERGYYDHPKRINMKELARLFGISQSTLAEIMQRGERKVMEQHFRETASDI